MSIHNKHKLGYWFTVQNSQEGLISLQLMQILKQVVSLFLMSTFKKKLKVKINIHPQLLPGSHPLPRLAYKPNNAPTESSRLAKKCRWSCVSVFHLPLVHTEHKKLLLDGKKNPSSFNFCANKSEPTSEKLQNFCKRLWHINPWRLLAMSHFNFILHIPL